MTIREKRVAFTGKLASMHRHEACQLVAKVGGRPVDTVSSKTDILVVGMEGWPMLHDGTISNKLRRAEALISAGIHLLEIISEPVFLERIGLSAPHRAGRGGCDLHQAARVLGIRPEDLKRWEQFGLIRSQQGRFEFRDLVSLRSIADLIHQGMSPVNIARGLQALSRLLDIDRPLAQVRLIAECGQLLAEFCGSRFDARGQLVLNFAAEETTAERAAIPPPAETAADEEAETWFEHGADCEEAGRWREAEAAYHRALALAPGMGEAHFNLGNILRMRGLLDQAMKHYRLAAHSDTELAALAWYNVAYLLEEQGIPAEAAEALRQAIHVQPAFADAYFNLASCYEQLGATTDALACWRHYLHLDSTSPWAKIARRHITRHRLAGVLEQD